MGRRKMEFTKIAMEFDPKVGPLQVKSENDPAVGDKSNYNFQPTITQYEFWPFSTIEWESSENRYRARAIVIHKETGDIVSFNTLHINYADAERAINNLSESLAGTSARPIYNIFGEILEIRNWSSGAPGAKVIEVLSLLISMQDIPQP